MRTLALSTLVILAACGASEKPLEVTVAPVKTEIAQPARPRPVDLADVQFRVVTKDTLDAFIAEQAKLQENDNPVFIAIGIKDYQALSLNLAELRRYIDQQNSIIVYYQKATAP